MARGPRADARPPPAGVRLLNRSRNLRRLLRDGRAPLDWCRKQRLGFPDVTCRADRPEEGERLGQLLVGVPAPTLCDELLAGAETCLGLEFQVSNLVENVGRGGIVTVPRGNNYIRLPAPPLPPLGVHITFNVGTYNGATADAALRRMAGDGYNVVRVWVNAEGETTPSMAPPVSLRARLSREPR